MPDLEGALLTSEHAARLETTLRSTGGDALTEFLWSARRRLEAARPTREALQHARELALVDATPDGQGRITPLGAKVADSLTEYGYWKRRGRSHHRAQELDAVRIEHLRDRRILEIGCGAGVNLLSLQHCAEVVGIDVEPLYLQVTPLLARLEGMPSPRRLCAQAEHLPFEDGSFDVALFFGSLPYMHIEQALREAARVLRPGGRIVAIHSDLAQVLWIRARQRGRRLARPGVFLRELRAAVGMALYPWLGRLLVQPFAPIHVTRRRTRRWLAHAGLQGSARDCRTIGNEACFVAEKPSDEAR
ncbi:MAG TPA: class I SAM-dependent methyltransferase [Planctomycetota bacterium]|nr:class I SAM-dependent methyltransferase [Planctomycetota bacterium]